MSGFDENPFGEPTTDNPFAVSTNVYLDISITFRFFTLVV